MSDNKKYYYLKLKEGFFESEDIILLESMENGYLYSNILLKLYLKSLKNEGKLRYKERIPYNPSMLSKITRHNVDVVEKALKIFVELGIVEILDNGTIFMMDIQEYIGKGSSEAERKQKYREKIRTEKLLEVGQCPIDVPLLSEKRPPEKEIEIEIEKEIDIEIENKKKKPNGFSELINSYTSNPNLNNTITEFIKMRKANKKVMTGRAIELMLEKLDNMASDDATKIAIINQSLENCWQGIFELKTETNKSQNNTYKTNMQKAYENIDWGQLEG